ncbi:MAG: phage tail sheath family protein [Gammaproteobacteria bacterium]
MSIHAYSTPGVYREESVPVEALGIRTGVPVFVGFVERERDPQTKGKGPDTVPKPCRLTRWDQFRSVVGRAHTDGYLDYAVRGFFENGGERCVVLPLRMADGDAFEELRRVFAEGGPLDDIEDADLVCIPDAMMQNICRIPSSLPIAEPYLEEARRLVYEVHRAVLEHCHRMGDRFAILDAVPIRREGSTGMGMGEPAIQALLEHWRALVPREGALYCPWLRAQPRSPGSAAPAADDPGDRGSTAEPRWSVRRRREQRGILVPPCGHVAGIYARSDMRIGVHKAPANEVVDGAWDLEADITDQDQGALNEVGVNCLRSIPGRGIRVWGARTLSRHAAGRYVNVQRLFLTFARWARRNFDDQIFEPNGPALWERVRFRLRSYCQQLFERGALKGNSPAEAYYVKCDAETNPREAREAGRMVAEIGLAPVAPAEFVIVRITQTSAGVSVSVPASA